MVCRRASFTLLEVMIVLAIIVSMMAIAWPRMRGMAAKTEIRQAAVEFKAACAQARQRAAQTGRPLFVHYRLGESQYRLSDRVDTKVDSRDVIKIRSPETVDSTADEPPLPDDDLELPSFQLPDGIVFDDPSEREIDIQAIEIGATNDLESLTDTESIAFYPDGRCETKEVRILAHDTGDSVLLSLRGLTGGVLIGAVEKRMETNPDDVGSFEPDMAGPSDVR